MSEEAKLALLQEKIKATKGTQRFGMVTLGIGVVFTVVGFSINGGAILGVLGLVAAIIGSCLYFYGGIQYTNLIKQFEGLATINPKCSKCGKELPKGNFEFCPFCGNSLKP